MYPYLGQSQHLQNHSVGSYFPADQALYTLFLPDSVELALQISNATEKNLP